MKKRGWIVALMFLSVVGYVIYSSFQIAQVSCEVCMDFQGRRACRTAQGASEADAVQTARDNACARLANGRTENILCGGTPPSTVSCQAN